jgi:hypothetical protein
LWLLVLSMVEVGVPEESCQPATTHWHRKLPTCHDTLTKKAANLPRHTDIESCQPATTHWHRKLPTCHDTLTNFITYGCKGETIHRMYRNHDYFGDGSVHDTWRPLTIQTMRCSFFEKKLCWTYPFSSFGDHLINILRKVNRLIYAFKIN